MAYLIFTANGEEFDRRELRAPIFLGRAPDCDVTIPDITLSRRHCRIEPTENKKAWQIVDLHSKNGTHFRGHKVESHVLRENDEVRIGRTRLTYKSGSFVASPRPARKPSVIRAADPHEALAGTVTGMVVCEPGETETHEGMPNPRPRPADPSSFAREDVYSMINGIASSSWDSIHAHNSQPVRMQRAAPVPGVTRVQPSRAQPRVSFALQAEPDEAGERSAKSPSSRSSKRSIGSTHAHRERTRRRRPWLIVATAVLTAVLALWVTLVSFPTY